MAKGELTISASMIHFVPDAEHPSCSQREELHRFEAIIAMNDISFVQKKQMHAEKPPEKTKLADKSQYMYDFFL